MVLDRRSVTYGKKHFVKYNFMLKYRPTLLRDEKIFNCLLTNQKSLFTENVSLEKRPEKGLKNSSSKYLR